MKRNSGRDNKVVVTLQPDLETDERQFCPSKLATFMIKGDFNLLDKVKSINFKGLDY